MKKDELLVYIKEIKEGINLSEFMLPIRVMQVLDDIERMIERLE